MVIDPLGACTGCRPAVVACSGKKPFRSGQRRSEPRAGTHACVDRYLPRRPPNRSRIREVDYRTSARPLHAGENAPWSRCGWRTTSHSQDGRRHGLQTAGRYAAIAPINCPKGKGFNFCNTHRLGHASVRLIYTPEVTVRSRGVMGECPIACNAIGGGNRGGKAARDAFAMATCTGLSGGLDGTAIRLANERSQSKIAAARRADLTIASCMS